MDETGGGAAGKGRAEEVKEHSCQRERTGRGALVSSGRISAEDWPAWLTASIGRVRQERQSSFSHQDAVGTCCQHLQVRLSSQTNLSCTACGRTEP